MSAFSNVITLTVTSPFSATARLSTAQLVSVIASGSGARVVYESNSAVNSSIIVTQTPAAIATASQMLISLTITGGTIYINPNRIVMITLDPISGTGSVVTYFDPEAPSLRSYTASETPAALQTAIAAIVGASGGGVTTGLTAFAGGGQGSATQLSFGYNEVTTVATAGDSVKLQPAQAGAVITVINDGANAMDVFPATGDKINDGSVNAAISMAPGNQMTFTAIDTLNWETSTQTLKTSSISEFTAGAGITMASRVIFSDINNYSSATGITAFAGGGQGSATQLTKEYNNVTVCATNGDSVKLLAAVAGLKQIVRNSVTNRDLAVFPATGDGINSVAVNGSVTIPPRCEVVFECLDGTTWKTNNESIASFNTIYSDVISPKTSGQTIVSGTAMSGPGWLTAGTITATGAGTPQTLNALAGTVEMTSVADIAADAAGTVVINNSNVTTSTVGLVALQTTTAAAGSTPRIESVAYGAGTITIVIRNSDPATATGAATYKFSFQLFQL